MRRLGIIQPGKIGDIIICLPIAKFYYDQGYEVYWPIDKNIISNFTGYVEYVNFIPINFDCNEAKSVCSDLECNTILDLAFTIPGASSFNSNNYLSQNKYSFDEYKYFLANAPFENKWKLEIKRNREKEEEIASQILDSTPFVLVQEQSSDYTRRISWENDQIRRIDISNRTTSIFDWLGVIEKAEQHILIESCFTNLIDQLNIIVNKQRLLLKHGYYSNKLEDNRLKGEPVLRLNWEKI